MIIADPKIPRMARYMTLIGIKSAMFRGLYDDSVEQFKIFRMYFVRNLKVK